MHTTSSAATPTGGRIALALAAVYVIWGSTYLAIRFALEGGFPPFLLQPINFEGLYAEGLRQRAEQGTLAGAETAGNA